jgi:hypothetical protein
MYAVRYAQKQYEGDFSNNMTQVLPPSGLVRDLSVIFFVLVETGEKGFGGSTPELARQRHNLAFPPFSFVSAA